MKKTKETFCCICGCSMKDNEGYPSPLESKILRLCERCHRGRTIVPLNAKPTVVYESFNDFVRLGILRACLVSIASEHKLHFTVGFLEELDALSSDVYCDIYGDPE